VLFFSCVILSESRICYNPAKRILIIANYKIKIPYEEIASFCAKLAISELSFFGSVLREDFDPKTSDIDVMISFIPGQHWGWEIVTMKEELELIFNRPIDLVTKKAIENSKNPFRKKEILESYQVIYEKTA
jgi:predicted nucleotidyltransferase